MTKYKWFELTENGKLTQEHINQWLSEGNSINVHDNDGNTALMMACQKNRFNTLLLTNKNNSSIENDENINYNNNPWYILIKNCEKDYYNLVNLLLDNNANPYILNQNKTAYDISTYEVRKLILSYHFYYLHKSIKRYINKQNKNLLNIKKN